MKKLIFILLFLPVLAQCQLQRIAYYPLNGNANDYSGNGYNGTPTNITYVSGKTGQCANFNGSAYITTPSFGTFSKTSVLTVSCIVRTTTSASLRLAYNILGLINTFSLALSISNASANKFNTGVYKIGVGADNAADINNAPLNTYCFITLKADASYVYYYLNGIYISKTAYAYVTSSTSNSSGWLIGGYSTLLYLWSGTIEDFQVINGFETDAMTKTKYAYRQGFMQ